ncbi:MAG: class I SAM-dependent methyltransferase [Polyangiaceae bacterium]
MKVRASDLLAWLASVPTQERDAAVEAYLGIAASAVSCSSPGEDMVGYHASGVAPIVRMLLEVPVVADDVFVDLGSGLGKVTKLARILTGATVRGIEIQPALVERARRVSTELRLDVSYIQADARHADLADGTVFFLYVPFTGSVLRDVLRNLRRVATDHAIVVCSLGVDLDREAPWLSRRPSDSFWLTLYDSVLPSVPERRERAGSPNSASPPGRPGLVSTATAIAYERPSD